jgi:hypothetical protein
MKQAIAKRHLPRILDGGRRDRGDRFLARQGLALRRLRNRRPCSAQGQNDQDRARFAAASSSSDCRQSRAVS